MSVQPPAFITGDTRAPYIKDITVIDGVGIYDNAGNLIGSEGFFINDINAGESSDFQELAKFFRQVKNSKLHKEHLLIEYLIILQWSC